MDSKKTPQKISPEIFREISSSLNQAMADITDIKSKLEKPQAFLHDTLSDFFDNYETCEKDISTLVCIQHSIQHYRVYIEATLEYLLDVPKKLEQIHNDLQNEFDTLKDGVFV